MLCLVCCRDPRNAYALLHVFLPSHHSLLPNLESHLGCLVVHEPSKIWRERAPSPLCLLRAPHLPSVRATAII